MRPGTRQGNEEQACHEFTNIAVKVMPVPPCALRWKHASRHAYYLAPQSSQSRVMQHGSAEASTSILKLLTPQNPPKNIKQ
eukprot:556109-Amphidinium_carterae.1